MLSSITGVSVLSNTQAKLIALRNALYECAQLQAWAAGVSAADLIAVGVGSADANSMLSGIADANGMFMLYTTGTDPRNPGPGYVYGASQRVVIGPQ